MAARTACERLQGSEWRPARSLSKVEGGSPVWEELVVTAGPWCGILSLSESSSEKNSVFTSRWPDLICFVKASLAAAQDLHPEEVLEKFDEYSTLTHRQLCVLAEPPVPHPLYSTEPRPPLWRRRGQCNPNQGENLFCGESQSGAPPWKSGERWGRDNCQSTWV